MRRQFILLIVAISALIIGFGCIQALDNFNQVKETQQQIKQLESDKTRLQQEREELEQKHQKSLKKIEQQKKTEEDLKKQIQDLQARKAEQARLASLLASRKAYAAPAVAVSGSCAEWLSSAGISDTASAMALINRESGCNPNAVNSKSGACGVAQELPCGKSGCSLGDGACQVRWMNSYVIGRYGSWSSALAHSNSLGWY